jgi:hypothetical protein
MFIALLRSNERGAGHRKHRSFIVVRVRFRGNVFTESLPSNKLFLLSGVMSQHIKALEIAELKYALESITRLLPASASI